MIPSPPPPPPRPNFIKGQLVKKLVERRATHETLGKFKNVLVAGVMVGCILLAAWLYTSTRRSNRGSGKEMNAQTKEKVEKLKEISEKKEAAFEEIKIKKDTLSEDDISLLAEAVKAQEDYVSQRGVLSSDNSRLEGLRKKLHTINAEILRSASRKAEEKAQSLEINNPAEAQNLLRQALEAEQNIQKKWIYSGLADIGKIARLDTRLRRMEATPIWKKTREFEKRAEEYFKEENIEMAADSIKEAINLENDFIEKYRDVLNTEFGRVERLSDRKETYNAYPLYKEQQALENEASAKEKEDQWKEAEKLWNLALEKQKQIIIKHPQSEYADQKHSNEIEKKRNIARTTPEVKKIKTELEEVRKKIREKKYEQAIEENKKLLERAQKTERINPGVLPEDSLIVQEMTFIARRQGMMKIINNASESFFINHPVNKDIKLMRHEIPQSFYEAVMGVNPSAVVRGNLPVESVNYEDTQRFCQQLSWITGRKTRLPTPAEFIQASEELAEKNIQDQAWTFDNTDGLTTRNVATTRVNNKGFYDLIGNVEEWAEAQRPGDEAPILGGCVNTVLKKEFPRRQSLKRERSRTLGFRVVQE
jgi:tetratricopeptide (TPR) repeat protein